jgi:hypothetical protein
MSLLPQECDYSATVWPRGLCDKADPPAYVESAEKEAEIDNDQILFTLDEQALEVFTDGLDATHACVAQRNVLSDLDTTDADESQSMFEDGNVLS